jgi:hypothetical protein
MFLAYTDEQLRVAINLRSSYERWVLLERERRARGGVLAWKTISGKDYLYLRVDRDGNGRSLGPRSSETEAMHADYMRSQSGMQAVKNQLAVNTKLYRAAGLPCIASNAARFLSEAHLQSVLDRDVIVVGTTAMAAYQLESAHRYLDGMHATEDLDLSWRGKKRHLQPVLMPVLKAVDDTYTVNAERTFQARNQSGFEIEILVSPQRESATVKEKPLPLPLIEQGDFLRGAPVKQFVCGFDGTPCKLIVPDPRWFALHKAEAANDARRNPLKRPKDARQARALWASVQLHMPQYPIDAAFVRNIPKRLKPCYEWLKNATP